MDDDLTGPADIGDSNIKPLRWSGGNPERMNKGPGSGDNADNPEINSPRGVGSLASVNVSLAELCSPPRVWSLGQKSSSSTPKSPLLQSLVKS
jgi:hypothetical protein